VVKKCMYCGQPLAREDARFCTECGRLQSLEPGPAEASGVIKVRLPPREIIRRTPPAAHADSQREHTPGPVRSRQGQSGHQPPPRPARRPVRLTPPVAQGAPERPEPAEESPPPPADHQPVPVEELSTMVLPGWREELEQLRKRQETADPAPAPSALISAVVVQLPTSRQPALPPAEKETQISSAVEAAAVPQPDAETTIVLPTDSVQRELHVRVWEQEPARRSPHVQVEKPEEMETRPAPAVEHPPFTPAFEEEAEVESLAEQAAIDWQALAGPGATHGPETEQEESRQQVADVRPQEAEGSEIEDLPTVPLAVPTAQRRPSAITIERASTPAPTGPDVSRQEMENQPTRPMPISQAGSPASASPVPGRGEGRGTAHSPYGAQGPVLPAASWQNTASPPLPTRGAPSLPARGPVSNPSPLPGQTFTPSGASVAHSPFSSPETMVPPSAGQRSPTTPPPVSPLPAPVRESRTQWVTPRRLVLLVGLIVVLGAGVFIISYQATSGGAQAYQAFENSTLGVFLTYPQGWAFHLDQAQTSVHFADSSQTGQVTLSRTMLGVQSLTQYLDQQITRLGIATPQFAPTRLFAGTNWQQVQGDIVQQGVTYMLDLYVTRHGTYLYTLIFLAPPVVYSRMEQESFTPLRASFRFIQGQ
jgi:hypothetical protein